MRLCYAFFSFTSSSVHTNFHNTNPLTITLQPSKFTQSVFENFFDSFSFILFFYTVNIRHNGKSYPITLPVTATAKDLKQKLESLTNVPTARQKYMVRGGLTDDTITDLPSIIKPGSTVMLLGTPNAEMISKPKVVQHFIEDLDPSQQVQKLSKLPIGFKNMGNTCYMNATLQALYSIEPLREMVLGFKELKTGSPDELHYRLVQEVKRCFENLQARKYESVMPIVLLNLLRKVYPQFAERDPQSGFYKQQDAEELLTQLFHSFSVVFGDKFTDDFTIQFKTITKDTANSDDVTIKDDESDLKVQCHISGTTNFLKTGLQESMKEKIEKRSPVSGVNSIYEVEKQITKLPRILVVQYVRFFWKRSTGKKSKILRKVAFPFQLDMAEMLEPNYRKRKIEVREELRNVEKAKEEKEREIKKQKVSGDSEPVKEDVADRDNVEVVTPREEFETKKAIEESQMEYWKNEFAKHFPSDLSPGENPSSVYDLIGVITHQGANSESGHYQAFIKDETSEEIWYKFNDDKVSVVDKEKIESLAGGGESDSALILIYKGLGL